MQVSGKFPGFGSRSYAALLTVVCLLVAVCGFALPAGAQTQMGAASQVTQMGALPAGGVLAGGSPAGIGMGVNSLGNVIAGTSYGNTIVQYTPAGVVTTLGTFTYVGPVVVDGSNNLYVGAFYNNLLTKIPFVGGAYAPVTTGDYGMATCTATSTTECTVPDPLSGTAYSVGGYASMAFDKVGNFFFSSTNGGSNPNAIFECSVACLKNPTTTPAVLVYQEPTSATAQLLVGGVTADASGNVFFTDSATNTTLDSTVSNFKEAVALTATTFAAPITLYTLTPASPGNYDNQIDAVAVDANNVYFATINDGIFAMPNAKGVVNKAGLFTVSNAGAKAMTTDGAGNFYVADYVGSVGGDAVERVGVNTLTAPATMVGSSSPVPNVTVYLSDTTCTGTPAPAATFTASNTEFSATLGKTCAANTLTNAATFASTVTFTPASSGIRTATLTAKDQLNNTFTFAATGMSGAIATVATPTFSVPAGTYPATQTVALADATSGASIYYTVNGTMPTASSTLYTGPITVATTETIMAIGVASGSTTSAVASATYTIVPPAAATPTFSPAAGTYTSVQSVVIASTTPMATIYYTTNGTAPTTSSTMYTGPVSVGVNETLMAIATATGFGQSAVGSAAYVITLPAATPAFTPVAGTYTSVQMVSISDTTSGAKIYYTLDGSVPTASSTLYSAPITVGVSETIKAIATATGATTSAVASAAYVINLPPTVAAATPTFTPAGGTYVGKQTVTIASSTAGAMIYYTINGSAPTTSSTLYTAPITVAASETVSAIAVATGFNPSATGSAVYTISAPPTPSFSLAINPAALTVMDGASGTVAVSITPTGGYASAVTLSCTGLPTGATCAFAPATVTPAGSAAVTSTLTVAAAARTSSVQTTGFGSVASGMAFAAMLCLLGFRKRRRVQLFLLLLVGVIGLGMMTGCGGSPTINHSPVLTSVTVSATDGTLTTSTVLNLTVN